MFIITGTSQGRRVMLIGIPGSALGGVRNSGMAVSLDNRMGRGAPLFDGVDFVSIVRADSRAELRQIADNNGLDVLDQVEVRPGVIEKPTGGQN